MSMAAIPARAAKNHSRNMLDEYLRISVIPMKMLAAPAPK